jgi:hypothetical protein
VRSALTLVLSALVLGGCGGHHGQVVLGSRHVVAHGVGWGTPRPPEIFNGGVPNGKAWRIRWENWAGSVARGRGLTWIYRPHGGYYGKPGRIELRAYMIGRCSPESGRTYLHLKARESIRPGGPLGRWFEWGGWRDLCHIS